jgi:hypothetical protein
VDAFSAGRLTRTLDPLHSVAYFVPDVGYLLMRTISAADVPTIACVRRHALLP